MSKKPVFVIMAAGMGSRYGGLKQIDPVDPYGNMIIDFSIYDAKQAGFEKVIFIIKKAIDEAFREGIGKRIEKYMDVEYVYQELDVLPKGYEVPEGRVKPWGTGHAILCAAEAIDGARMLGVKPQRFMETTVPCGSPVQVAPSSSVYSACPPWFSILVRS